MILSLIKINPHPRTRREILDILRNAECVVRTKSGCLGASVYLKRFEEELILYLEHWQSREEFEQHVRSSQYDRILAALDLASAPPEIEFFENDDLLSGMGVIRAIRNQVAGKEQVPDQRKITSEKKEK
jgi:quinol monooxygenase YgiN